MALAWHIGALSRQSKKYPKLNSLLIKPTKPVQTWQQQLAIAKMWAGHNLGKIKVN